MGEDKVGRGWRVLGSAPDTSLMIHEEKAATAHHLEIWRKIRQETAERIDRV